MEHRLAEKRSENADPIKAACQFILQPCFHRMGEAEPVQINVALDNLFADPRLCPFTTSSYDRLESRIQPKPELPLFSGFVSIHEECERHRAE